MARNNQREAGGGGRGGYNGQMEKLSTELDNIHRVCAFCMNEVDCRRKIVLEYFGENFNVNHCNKTCDNCKYVGHKEDKDLTAEAKDLVQLCSNLTSGGGRRGPLNVSILQLLKVRSGPVWLVLHSRVWPGPVACR